MKKLLLMVCALFGFMACTQNPIEEQSAIRTDAPETIRVGFEDDETRIQLNSAQKTVWTKEDLVSVFYRSDANQKWQYQGETGERVGDLKRVENATSTTKTTKTVVVYPYSDSYWLNTDTFAIDATLPAIQYYTEGSYGVGSNLMVSQSEFTQFSLKSVCGWLKLQLTGDGEVVKSIKFRGNDGEQVAGLIYVDTATAEATLASDMGGTDDNNAGGNLVFDDTILTEITLDCGEGVTLGAEATPFYISLPPQTFAKGFTVEIECEDYELMTLTTEKELVIERNTIQPMACIEHNAECILSLRQIHYHSINGKIELDRWTFDTFGANIISHELNENSNLWIITFDDMVTSIGDYAFSGCRDLVYITIPEKVSRIGKNAFYSSNLALIYFWGNNVTSIGDYAFYECHGLRSIAIPDSVTTIGDYAFYRCNSLTSVTIPDSVTTIGDYAFYDCTDLTSVAIPDSVTTIGDYAFYRCNSLTSVTIPDSVTTIGDYAFSNCYHLKEFNSKFASEDGRCLIIDGTLNSFAIGCGATEYTIPNSVTTIGDGVFYWCSSLTSVTIPDSVTTIGNGAFCECSSLTSVYCKAVIPPAAVLYFYGDWAAFDFNASGRTIYVPMESVEAYKSASGWSSYADAIEGYNF